MSIQNTQEKLVSGTKLKKKINIIVRFTIAADFCEHY